MKFDYELTSFSLVARCPYCGARSAYPQKKRDGSTCKHPTMMVDKDRRFRGFTAIEGVVRQGLDAAAGSD